MPPDDAESSCHEHQSQHSTINWLPPEVLTEVFKHCIPNPGDFTGIPNLDLAPLLLCRVCSSWRTLAQSTPDLWNTVGIRVTKEAKVGLEGVARFITTWLERSSTLPLTIHLEILARVSKALVDTIFKSLCEHALRWESVSIQQPYRACVLPLTGNELPLLQSFKFDYDYENGYPDAYSLPFASAPRLTYLHWPYPIPLIGHPSVPWHQLRHVHFQSGLSLYTVTEILQNCPELLELDVNIEEVTRSDDLLPREPRILHRRLRRLNITILGDCAPLLDSLTLPALQDLSLRIRVFPANNPAVQAIHEQLMELFSRSECTLDKLALFECRFNASMLQECFRHKSLAKLTELEIEAYKNCEPMVIDDVLYDLTCIPCAEYGMLLPKLSSLTFGYCLSGSPGTLGRMILSRCPGPEKEGNRLKHFLLVEEQLDPDDKKCIDEACLQGLTAEIHIEDCDSFDSYYDSDI
ncbi:hypothetical protein AX17_002614 [Amanita inopinata Kibby_2008]|nr:hypothetical protein AX17_002614 [Amanita inopinata Kibby_2008]